MDHLSEGLGGCCQAAALKQSFVRPKEEGAVCPNGAAHGKPKLVSLEFGKFVAQLSIKEACRIQVVIAMVCENGAVQLIGPGFGHGINDAAPAPAIFRAEITGENRELANCFHPQNDPRLADGSLVFRVVGIDPIQEKVVFRRAPAGNGQTRA